MRSRTLLVLALALALALACGCGATIDDNDVGVDASQPVDAPARDAAPPDVAIDARACAGGDATMVTDDGSCLVLFTTVRTFTDASNACGAFGSQLAVVDSPSRQTTAAALAGTRSVFIGLTDAAVEGQFRWVDGSALVFSSFAAGEPNDANGNFAEDCIILDANRGGLWDDRPCAPDPATTVPGAYAYLCQF